MIKQKKMKKKNSNKFLKLNKKGMKNFKANL